MCGIVGYIGPREAVPFLIEGLRRLEYRGYDSAGVATIDHGSARGDQAAGRLDNLVNELAENPCPAHIGIGHTRWATHGPATDVNAHPHVGGDWRVAVVHNGVIENFRPLKSRLEERRLLLPLGDRQRSDRPPDRQLPRRAVDADTAHDATARRSRCARRRSPPAIGRWSRRCGRRWRSCKAPTGWRSCFATIPT